MSARAKAMKNLYRRGRLTQEAVEQAHTDGIITEEEMLWILEA